MKDFEAASRLMSDAADADAAAADEERRRKRAEAAREKRAEQALAKGRQPGQRGRPGKQPAQLPPASPEPAHREREEPGSGNTRPRQAVRRDDVADARAELARLQALQESGGGPSNLDVLLAECIEAVDIAEDIAAAEAAEAAIAEDIAAAEAAIAADIAAAEAAEAAELIAAVEAVELEAAEAAAVVGADAEAAEAAAVVVADAGIIDAANASRFPPPRVTQHSDAATWYRRMMGYALGASPRHVLVSYSYNRNEIKRLSKRPTPPHPAYLHAIVHGRSIKGPPALALAPKYCTHTAARPVHNRPAFPVDGEPHQSRSASRERDG